MKREELYNDEFYRHRDACTRYAAETILGIVAEYFDVSSMVDVGCGVGTWLSVGGYIFQNEYFRAVGYDGTHVNAEYLVIPKDDFRTLDLSATNAMSSNEHFDFAVSLEVAEHLPYERAHSFVKELCNLAPVVLFSAATKRQGGDGHINEQRLSYWVSLFSECQFSCYDAIRPQIWSDSDIPVWYRQNTVLFLRDTVAVPEALLQYSLCAGFSDILHPEMFENRGNAIFREQFYKEYAALLRRGEKLEDVFCKRNLREIAIYGLGEIGKIIAEELDGTGVSVKYAIDKSVNIFAEIPVFDEMDHLPAVDMIVITPMQDYDVIAYEIEKHMTIPYIGLSDLLGTYK